MADQRRKPAYLPTPEDIERECKDIRSRWGDNEQEYRARSVAEESELPVQHEDETSQD